MKPSSYRFTIPSLPKEWYQTVKEAQDAYQLTQWQAIVLALACLRALNQSNPDQVKLLADQVRETYRA